MSSVNFRELGEMQILKIRCEITVFFVVWSGCVQGAPLKTVN